MDSEEPIAIHINHVFKNYGSKVQALDDVHFDVPEGKICCLLGPNGSGKTSLLKILAGLLLPSSGTATIMGTDVQDNPLKTKSKIGWMPADEKMGFYGRLTGRQNLKFFAALHKLGGKSFERSLGNISLLLDINDQLDTPFQKVSTGNRQRVGLARVLMSNPDVLILDEPFRTLDPHSAIRLRRLLKDHLAKVKNKTILLSTHQLDEASKVADMIVVMDKGSVISIMEGKALRDELKKKSLEELYLKLFKDRKTQQEAEA